MGKDVRKGEGGDLWRTAKKPSQLRFRPPRSLTRPVARRTRVRGFDLLALRLGFVRRVGVAFVHLTHRPSVSALRRLPQAFERGFDLLALRARRKEESRGYPERDQGRNRMISAHFAHVFRPANQHPCLSTGGKLCG